MNNKRLNPDNNTRTRRAYSPLGINKVEEPVKKEKSIFVKTASFLGSVYYNISKVLIVSIALVGTWVLVTNYNVFPVIEKIFVREEGTDSAKETLVEITGLDFNKESLKEEEFKAIKEKIDSELSNVILEKTLFDGGQIAFNDEMKAFCTQNYIQKLETENILYNALENIYAVSNRYPYSVSLTSIGKVIRGNNAVTKAVVDINAVDDDRGFHITSLALFFNDRQQIQDMSLIFEDKEYVNTRTPLDEKYSLITNSNTNVMIREINKFSKEFTNKALYDKIQINALDINNSQLKSFLSNLDIENKDYDTLIELFKLVKGASTNFAIVEYSQTDFDAVPITNIIIGVKTTERTYKYNLEFNRNSETLVSISKI